MLHYIASKLRVGQASDLSGAALGSWNVLCDDRYQEILVNATCS